jgi:hypothetical protein
MINFSIVLPGKLRSFWRSVTSRFESQEFTTLDSHWGLGSLILYSTSVHDCACPVWLSFAHIASFLLTYRIKSWYAFTVTSSLVHSRLDWPNMTNCLVFVLYFLCLSNYKLVSCDGVSVEFNRDQYVSVEEGGCLHPPEEFCEHASSI